MDFLHSALDLPDFGEVKMQITVQKDGRVVKVVVLKAESEKNKGYLETHLRQMKLPPLSGSTHEETFTITFCNEL